MNRKAFVYATAVGALLGFLIGIFAGFFGGLVLGMGSTGFAAWAESFPVCVAVRDATIEAAGFAFASAGPTPAPGAAMALGTLVGATFGPALGILLGYLGFRLDAAVEIATREAYSREPRRRIEPVA